MYEPILYELRRIRATSVVPRDKYEMEKRTALMHIIEFAINVIEECQNNGQNMSVIVNKLDAFKAEKQEMLKDPEFTSIYFDPEFAERMLNNQIESLKYIRSQILKYQTFTTPSVNAMFNEILCKKEEFRRRLHNLPSFEIPKEATLRNPSKFGVTDNEKLNYIAQRVTNLQTQVNAIIEYLKALETDED